MTSSLTSRVAALVAAVALTASPLAAQAEVTTSFGPGDLVRGVSSNAVYYYAADGHRYVFPNEKTYFTWYSDFSKVKTLPDATLGTLPLGRSNVTYRPGVKMVKITTDPRTYVVDQGGVLRWVPTEQIAQSLYGLSWKGKIDDVADAFFINYRVGTPLENASSYNAQDAMTRTPTIAVDKQFDETSVTVSIASMTNGFVPMSTTIKVGHKVMWVNNDTIPHTITGTGFDSGILNPGQSFTRVFNTTGSFNYHCSIHSAMKGTINVVN